MVPGQLVDTGHLWRTRQAVHPQEPVHGIGAEHAQELALGVGQTVVHRARWTSKRCRGAIVGRRRSLVHGQVGLAIREAR